MYLNGATTFYLIFIFYIKATTSSDPCSLLSYTQISCQNFAIHSYKSQLLVLTINQNTVIKTFYQSKLLVLISNDTKNINQIKKNQYL